MKNKSILYNFTAEELQTLLDTSNSYSDVLRKVGLNPKGGNPETLKTIIKEFQLDETQLNNNRSELFSGCALQTRLKLRIPTEKYLNNECKIQSAKLLSRLVNEGYKEYKCECCGISEWMEKPISLQLHHKNGNHNDNTLENLEVLCPNCHTQTNNYGGKSSQDKKKNKIKRNKTQLLKQKIARRKSKEQEREEILSTLPEGVEVKPLYYKDLDFSNRFLITSTGELFSIKTNKFLKKVISSTGYYHVSISCGKRNTHKMIKLGMAVALNFVDGYEEGLKVRHKDGNKLNDDVSNLEWTTQKEIAKDMYKRGLLKTKKIKCVETEEVFDSLKAAAKWAGLKDDNSINEYFRLPNKRHTAGKHPITGEGLTWELIND